MVRWAGTLGALAAGGAALAIFWSERFAYGDFLPLRGYQPIHGHVMAPQEGLFLGLYVVLGSIAVLGLGVGAFRVSSRLGRVTLADGLERAFRRFPDVAWMALLGCLSFVLSLVVSEVVLDSAFLTDDEMAMLFQAELLRSGRLWAEPTPFPETLHYAMMIESPRWYGIYPIGHPSVMALSLMLTGSPRALFALVAASWVALTFLLARRLFSRATAVLAASLMSFSPFFVLSSGTLAAELTSGLFLLVAANAAVRVEGRRSLQMSAILGLSLGVAYLARPYTTLAFSVPLAVWVAAPWFRKRASAWVPLVVVACAVPFVVGYLWINAELTGSPWLTPYEVNFPGRFKIGFGQDAFGVTHTPSLAAAVAGLTLFELNSWVLGWPLSLLPVAAGVTLDRVSRPTLFAASLPLCVMLAFVPVPMAGVQDTGPLYYLEVLPLIVILAARGLLLAGRRMEGWLDGRGRDLVAWLAVTASLVGASTFGWQQVDVLRSLSAFNNAPYEVSERVVEGRAIVFVENIQTTPPSSWVLGVRPPRPDLSDRLVYGNVVGHERAREVLRWAGGRRGYYLSRDHVSGDVSLVPLAAP